jgi:dTDP-4-amino-4,6-dideoxygalactose transaminase
MAGRRQEIGAAVERILASGRFLLGPELEAFESEFAEFSGHRFARGVASGTDALRLTLVGMGLQPGDEVIVPAFTAVPTVAAVCAAGLTPVLVDVDREMGTIDHRAAQQALTERTRALIVVHLYGRPATIPDIGVPVVEDAAHAHGALGQSNSVAVAYSFYPTKNLGGLTDGGAVVTNDAALADRITALRTHGRSEAGYYEAIETNSRLSEVNSAVLRIGLRSLDADNARRREIVSQYRSASPGMHWPPDHPRHVQHLCVVRVPERDLFRERAPFETGVHYARPVTHEPAYRRFARDPCPHAEDWARECVTLPCFPEMTDSEVDEVSHGLA